MEKNIFGRKLPRLGFGCMRLSEGQDGYCIEDECQQMFALTRFTIQVKR